MKIGSHTFSNCHFENNGEDDIAITTQINDFVFCASFGRYTRAQHLEMVNGALSKDGSRYKGNPKLTCFAEIDLLDFIAGLQHAAPKTPQWKTSYPASKAILDAIVQYGETRNIARISSGFSHDPSRIAMSDYLRTIFVKPERFSPEREFRIALGANAPNMLTGSPLGLLISDKRLKRSLIRMGHL